MTTMADIRDHISVDLAMARVLWLCDALPQDGGGLADDLMIWEALREYSINYSYPKPPLWTNREIVTHMDAAIAQARVMRQERE